MAYRNFYDRLNKLIAKLDAYFTPNYGPTTMESFQKLNAVSLESKRIYINKNDYPQLFFPYTPHYYQPIGYVMPIRPQTTTIINNNNYHTSPSSPDLNSNKTEDKKVEKSKEEEKDKPTQSTLGGMAIIGAVAVSGTYIISTDEYTNYVNSGIEGEINNFFIDIILMMKDETEIADASRKIKYCFDDWSQLLKVRTYQARNAKVAGTLSGILGGGGLLIGSWMVMIAGGFGVIAAGSFLTLNYFTKRERSEIEMYNDLLTAMRDNLTLIADKYYEFTYPKSVDNLQPETINNYPQPTYYSQIPVTYNSQSINHNFQPINYNNQFHHFNGLQGE